MISKTTLISNTIERVLPRMLGLVVGAAFVGLLAWVQIGSAVAMDSPADLVAGPAIGVSKMVSAPAVKNDDASYTIDFLVTVANLGDEDLNDLQVIDDLETGFGPGSIMIIEGLTPSAPFGANPFYDGEIAGDQNLLTGLDPLSAGETMTINLSVTVAPEITPPGPFENTAIASAVAADGMPVSDESSPGSTPTVDDAAQPTSFTFNPAPQIGAAKALTAGPTLLADGTFDMSFRFVVDNLGNTPLLGLRLDDDFGFALGAGATVEVLELAASEPFSANPNFDGMDDFLLLPEEDTLGIGESMTVDLTVNVMPEQLGTFENLAYAKALSPTNVPVVDETHDGSASDPDLDGDPIEHHDPTVMTLIASPDLSATNAALEPVLNADGTWRVEYLIEVVNTGDVNLDSVQLVNNLAGPWADVAYSIVGVTSDDLAIDIAYDGATADGILLGSDVLAPGQSGSVRLVLNVASGELPPSSPVVIAAGVSPYATIVTFDAVDAVFGVTTTTAANTTTTVVANPTSTTVANPTSTTASTTPPSSLPVVIENEVPVSGELPVTGNRNIAMLVFGFVFMSGGAALIIGTRREIAKRSYFLR